jgi:hypothetical protein
MIRNSLLVLALCAGTAAAQPGAGAAGAQPGADGAQPVDLDALIAKIEAEAPRLETVARGTFDRARRAISIGPTIGLWGTGLVDTGDLDAALTFGLGIETFRVPVVPSTETVKALIVERVKAQAKDRIAQAFQGRPPDPVQLDAIVAQVYAEVRDELLGVRNVRAKTIERPRLTFALEANRVFGAERWLGRTRVGVGVWKVTLAASLAVGRVCRGATCDDGVKVFAGPEVVLHLLMSKNPRASVVDAFVRFDVQTNGRGGETYDQLVLGARYLLDVL